MYYFSLVFYSVAVTNPRKIRVTYKSDCQKCQFFVFGEVGLGYTDIPIEKFTIKMSSLTAVIPKLYHEYISKTPKKLKIIDAYLLYIFLTAVIQFVYCCLVGTFPFNSFLSGFISTVSSFVLGGKRYFWKYLFMPTDKSSSPPPQRPIQWAVKYFFLFAVCLRLQANPENKNEFQGLSAERGFADFIFAHLVLHIVVINFIG